MSRLVGRSLTVFDEKTGDSNSYTFTDSPLNRFMGGILAACDAHELSEDETAALLHFFTTGKSRLGKSLPAFWKKGMGILVERGWVRENKRSYVLLDFPEVGTIYRAGTAAAQFGESCGRA